MYEEFYSMLQGVQNVAVIAHFRPDGDAIGSTLALGLALRAMGKNVRMWNEDSLPARYEFMQAGAELEVVPDTLPQDLQLLVCVDNGDWKRLGDRAAEVCSHAPLIANIDHHGTNTRYGAVNVVEPGGPATGFVVFKMLKEWGCTITPAMAEALYVAVNTDTGSFQYGCTTPEVMHAAAELIAAGADVAEINRKLYQELPLTTMLMQREVLNNMVVEHGGLISHYSMPAGRKQELGVTLEDTKDLVDVVRMVKGVKVAVIFEDLEDGRIRMSLRSKDRRVNVSDIATQFGGGGHSMAAGIRCRGGLEDVRSRVLQAIRVAVDSISQS